MTQPTITDAVRTQYCTGCKERQEWIAKLRSLVAQYRSDLIHPMTEDSKQRRIAAIDNALRSTNNV